MAAPEKKHDFVIKAKKNGYDDLKLLEPNPFDIFLITPGKIITPKDWANWKLKN